jgi:NAD(P)-dependent dehydrogenase (short-subunit alcohol dehydrogenase family)
MTTPSYRVSLSGQRLLITGAASGIGLSLLRSALEDRAECAALVRNPAEAAELFALLPAQRIHQIDLLESERVATVARAAIGSLGGSIDGLVCSAGVFDNRGVLDTDLQQWQSVIGVNLTATFEVARECAQVMSQADRGSIVLISSQIGIIGHRRAAAYSASKAALH